MNCTNCGAPMEFHESRRYFACGHCGTVRAPEQAEGDVQVLGVERDAPRCPACRVPLAAALLNQGAAHYCERCGGLLLARQTFVDVVQAKRAWATNEPREPGPLDRRALERVAECPRCGTRMATHPYYGPGRIVIDSCESCHLVWLDGGELDRIVDAPGRDRGSSLRGGEGAWPAQETEPPGTEPRGAARRERPGRRRGRIDLLKLLLDDD